MKSVFDHPSDEPFEIGLMTSSDDFVIFTTGDALSEYHHRPRVKATRHRESNSGLMSEVVKELSIVSEEDELADDYVAMNFVHHLFVT